MMRTYFSILALAATVALTSACGGKKDAAVFSGDVKSTELDQLVLVGLHDTLYISVDNGTFSDTISKLNGYYFLQLPNREVALFFEGGDKITMSVEQDLSTVKFSGDGAEKMNYLLAKFDKLSAAGMDYSTLYQLDEKAFKSALDKLFDDIRKEFEGTKVSKDFRLIEVKAIDYAYFNLLRAYPSYHPYVSGNTAYKMSADFFPKEYLAIDLNNVEDFDLYREYVELASAAQMEKFYKSIEPVYPNIEVSHLAFLDEIRIPKLKNRMVEQAAFFMSTSNADMKGFYEKLRASTTDEAFAAQLEERYTKMSKLIPGMPSPKFRYEAVAGNFVSLDDLKGKYVYIDVWATWCGPCKAEFPALKSLHEAMKGKNIALVSISVDQERDKETWKNMVSREQLGGIQLFADNAFRSHFAREYAIESIPRFILIDPQGNIVNADAPRPSADGTIEYLTGIMNRTAAN